MILRRKSKRGRSRQPQRSRGQNVLLKARAQELLNALAEGAIWPAFQPLVDIHTGAILGFEVLARWTDPNGLQIPPSEFIPVAEEAGLIQTLTEKIVFEACRRAVNWPGPFVLAFNISPTQFRDPDLFRSLTATVGSTGFPLNRIHVEITETALLQNDEASTSTIHSFKSVGISLALDDFGTGFASLTSLHGFPFDKIKIDMSFVRSMQQDSDSRKIVASVIGLGQSLGMTVVAEGVETEEQASILRRLGCDVGQGYLYGRPTNHEQTARLIGRTKQQGMPTRAVNETLFQRLHHLDALYKAAPIGLCFLDVDMSHVSVNDRFAEMLGHTPHEMVGRTVHDFMPPQEARDVAKVLKRVLAGETVIVEDFQPGDGDKSFLVINQRVDDDAGEPIGISVTAIDVTEKKTVEAVLRDTEDHARWSIGLIPNIPWSADANGVVNFMGPTPDSKKRTTADRIADWHARMHPDDRDRVRQQWLEWLPCQKPFETMFRLRLQDNTWRWMLSRAMPHHDLCGDIHKWFGVISEIPASYGVNSAVAHGQPVRGRSEQRSTMVEFETHSASVSMDDHPMS